jgi:hypothetical protein
MSAKTTHRPSSVSGQARGDYVTLAEVSRILGRHVSAVKSIALAGAIRTRVHPGARILYSRPDAERLASAG